MNQTSEKLVLGLILIPLAHIWIPKTFFSWILPLLQVRHCCKLSLHVISRKINEPNFGKWQKTQFQDPFQPLRPKFKAKETFSLILPLLHVRHFCKLSFYAISSKTNGPNLRKEQKTLFRTQNVFPKILLGQSLDIMVSYYHLQNQEKLMIQP